MVGGTKFAKKYKKPVALQASNDILFIVMKARCDPDSRGYRKEPEDGDEENVNLTLGALCEASFSDCSI